MLKTGDKVRIHDYSLLATRDDQYGTVQKVTKKNVKVKMKNSGQVVWATHSNFIKV